MVKLDVVGVGCDARAIVVHNSFYSLSGTCSKCWVRSPFKERYILQTGDRPIGIPLPDRQPAFKIPENT
ncbi:MAG: hypothetical protein P2A85_10015 [Microcoleus anatoxicus]|uniref:hypothetical protein n=1 Tax=Microcoleus anatoxicus TaxID=2705319 RepID=UPI00366C41A8